MKKPKAIIYDNDGMVTHGGRFSEKYAQDFGVDPAVMAPFFGEPLKKCQTGAADLRDELQKVMGAWRWKGTVDELMQYWFAIGDVPYEDILASVVALRGQGLIACLATNNEKYRTEYLVSKLSYDTVFDCIFSSAELGAYKQSAEGAEKIFQILKERYGITDKGEVLYWDDREGNVASLGAMGFNAELYRDYDSFKSVLEGYGFRL